MGCCHSNISKIRIRTMPVRDNSIPIQDLDQLKKQLNWKKVLEVPKLNLESNKLFMSRKNKTVPKYTSNSEISLTDDK